MEEANRVSDWDVFEQQMHAVVERSKSHITSALKLLLTVVTALFGTGDMDKLIEHSDDPSIRVGFLCQLKKTILANEWAVATAKTIVCIMKQILSKTTISVNFIKTLKLSQETNLDENDPLIPKYASLPDDNPVKLRLREWIVAIKRNSKSRSHLSVRNVIHFYLHICNDLQIDLNNWPSDAGSLICKLLTDDKIRQLCGLQLKKMTWLELFCKHVLKVDFAISTTIKENVAYEAKEAQLEKADRIDDDGTDHHRISSDDLDALYAESTKNVFDELTFLLMITTGMRIGGVANIRKDHIADYKNNTWTVRAKSKTMEKGKKQLYFQLTPRIQELVGTWLQDTRHTCESPFLFPGRNQPRITTAAIRRRFKALCKACGLVGECMHPHALRHSFAHLMLDNGNSPALVAKLLNHTSSAVTEKYYLKENAHEVMSRVKCSWSTVDANSGETEKKRKVPNFLNEARATAPEKDRQRKKKRRIAEQVKKLPDIFN